MLYGIALRGKTYYNVRCFVMKKTYALENLDCANCARKMEEAIRRIDGVQDAQVNFLTQKMTVSAEEADFAAIMKQVVKVCRRVEPDCSIIL